MWMMAVAALVSAGLPQQDRIIFQGVDFGPRRVLTCTWFSNFENSRFEQCVDESGRLFKDDRGASLRCLNGACKLLEQRARRLSRTRGQEAPEGTFEVRLIGRISLRTHRPAYLGDGIRTVLIEKIEGVRKLD